MLKLGVKEGIVYSGESLAGTEEQYRVLKLDEVEESPFYKVSISPTRFKIIFFICCQQEIMGTVTKVKTLVMKSNFSVIV